MSTRPQQQHAKYKGRPEIPDGFDYVEPKLFGCAHLIQYDGPASGSSSNTNSIYLGPEDATSSKALSSLQEANIRGIVNCTPSLACHHRDSEIAYCQVPVNDERDADLLVYLQGATTFMHHILSATAGGGSILVHCQFGVSRSATVVMAYFMRFHNCSRDEAYVLVKRQRPQAQPNEGFWGQLEKFEAQLKKDKDSVYSLAEHKEGETQRRLDSDWALQSNATFVTCREIPNYDNVLASDEAWKYLKEQGESDLDHVLFVCLDFVWGRGLLPVDLAWLQHVCHLLEVEVATEKAIKMVTDPESDFCSTWSGEIYDEQIQRLRRALCE